MTTTETLREALDIARECIAYEEHGQGLHCEIFNGAVTAEMVLKMARTLTTEAAAPTLSTPDIEALEWLRAGFTSKLHKETTYDTAGLAVLDRLIAYEIQPASTTEAAAGTGGELAGDGPLARVKLYCEGYREKRARGDFGIDTLVQATNRADVVVEWVEKTLPLLREWTDAEMERQGGRDRAGEGESIARRCYDADRALLAALRGEP